MHFSGCLACCAIFAHDTARLCTIESREHAVLMVVKARVVFAEVVLSIL